MLFFGCLATFSKYKGDVQLGFNIFDTDTDQVVVMKYAQHGIELTNQLWEFISKAEDIGVVLN